MVDLDGIWLPVAREPCGTCRYGLPEDGSDDHGNTRQIHAGQTEREIQTWLGLQVSKASMANITGVDRSTLSHCIRSRRLRQQ
jgi:hypothetical protein